MASDSRALTLKLLADTADFQKKLAAGAKDVDTIGERIGDFAKKAALAFAAAGAAVGAFAASAVKAAAEDEEAQRKLADTIDATTSATAAQIAGVEKYISTTSVAIGVTDDQLRPAFSRLVRSTKDVEEAQELLNLALDLSAATGRPLEAVTNALARAYDGNFTSLGRLGLGIDANALKSKDLDAITQSLAETYGSFAENEATSTQKQMERVSIALDEAKESIGAALLPVVQELTTWILENFIPALEAFIAGLTGNGGLNDSLTDSQKTAVEWGKKVRGFINTIVDLKEEILILGGVLATVFTVNKIATAVAATIALIKGLITAYNALKASAIVAGVAQAFALNPLLGVGAAALAAGVLSAANALANRYDTDTSGLGARTQEDYNALAGVRTPFVPQAATNVLSGVGGGGNAGGGGGGGGGGTRATATAPKTATQTLIEQVTAENAFNRIGPGNTDVSGVRRADEVGNVIVNVNAPSVIDEEGFTRAMVLALNTSQRRNGGGSGALFQ